MRLSVILGFGLALTASSLLAQQPKTYAPKKPYLGKTTSVPPATAPATTTSSGASDLRRIERESARMASNPKAGGPRPHPGSVRLLQSKPAPPINAGGGGGMGVGTKGSSMTNQGKNPYHGRLHKKNR